MRLLYALSLLAMLPSARKNKDLLLIRGGSFMMQGKTPVSISGFYLSRYELTMEEFDSFCRATHRPLPPDKGWGRNADMPAIHVSWYDAIEYCNWRSINEQLTPCYTLAPHPADTALRLVTCDWAADGYRLPTEAEWAYAAQGGRKSRHYLHAGSNELSRVAWFADNAQTRAHPVGDKKPNELGLYDMTGNLWEWCWHWHDEDTQTNTRILRGGSWRTNAFNSNLLTRIEDHPTRREDDVGFRVARSLPSK